MFTVHEEKNLFFPNHSWSDFQRLYVNKVSLVEKAWDNYLQSSDTRPSLGKDLLESVVVANKRLREIDTIIAKPQEVVFEPVLILI